MPTQPESEELTRLARTGDEAAINQLLIRHRDRLKRMVTVHMDDRLRPRIDPSDVVQEALLRASRRLPSYLDQPKLSFYPWLRQMAWECLVDLHRRHVRAATRSVEREAGWPVSNESVVALARQLVDGGSSPSRRVVRNELRARVCQALEQLSEADRELLLMRHLEQLKVMEMAAVLQLTEPAVKSRLRRALERLHRELGNDIAENIG